MNNMDGKMPKKGTKYKPNMHNLDLKCTSDENNKMSH